MRQSFGELSWLHLVGWILGAAEAVEAVPEFVGTMAFEEAMRALHRGYQCLSFLPWISGYLCEAR
jgi:hypothetical protein